MKDAVTLPEEWPRRVRELVRDTPFFPALTADREPILALTHGVERAITSANRPLRILLLGGTGAGKSTLLNALAADEVAEVGELRPTTRSPTIYLHREDPVPDLGGLESDAAIHTHEREELRGKAVIDLPDPDSGDERNAAVLRDGLEAADLVLVVSSPEKYLSAVIFDLLRAYGTGREFLFVLNKIDEAGEAQEALGRDLEKVLAARGFPGGPLRVSALHAFLNRTQGTDRLEGDFARLERAIGVELDRVRSREIRQRNLWSRAGGLIRRVRSRLPEDLLPSATRWRERADVEAADLVDATARGAAQKLAGSLILRDALVRRSAGRIRSLFGFSLAVSLGLRGLVHGTYLRLEPGRSLADSLASEVLPPEMEQRLSRDLNGVVQAFALEARGFGVSDAAVSAALEEELRGDAASRVCRAARSRLGEEIRGLLERPPPRAVGWVGNLLAWGVALALGGRLIGSWLGGAPWDWDAVTGGAVLLVLLLALEAALARPILELWSRRQRRLAARRVAAALGAAYTEEIARPMDRVLTRIMAPHQEIQELEHALPPASRPPDPGSGPSGSPG